MDTALKLDNIRVGTYMIFYYFIVLISFLCLCYAIYFLIPIGKRKGKRPDFFMVGCSLLGAIVLGGYSINKLLIYYDVVDKNYTIKPIGFLGALVLLAGGINEIADYRKFIKDDRSIIKGKVISIKTFKGNFRDKYAPTVEYYIGSERNTYTQKKALPREFRYVEGDEYLLQYNYGLKKVYSDVDCKSLISNGVFLIIGSILLAVGVIIFL